MNVLSLDEGHVKRLHSGEEAILSMIMDQCLNDLVFMSALIVRSKEEAEEIVLSVLCKLWDKRADFKSAAKIQAFLYISVRNNSLTRSGKLNEAMKRREALPVAGTDNWLQDAEDRQIAARLLQMIYHEIEKLPKKRRAIMKMYFMEGLSAQQIAEKQGIAIKTVRNQIGNGINKLNKSKNLFTRLFKN